MQSACVVGQLEPVPPPEDGHGGIWHQPAPPLLLGHHIWPPVQLPLLPPPPLAGQLVSLVGLHDAVPGHQYWPLGQVVPPPEDGHGGIWHQPAPPLLLGHHIWPPVQLPLPVEVQHPFGHPLLPQVHPLGQRVLLHDGEVLPVC